ncbi:MULTISPECIES: DrmE family protein [Clostridium]|nr:MULTISPECIES: DrmE family protein [Clostridium]KIU07482.1 hypothetical protein SC08_Contig83orf01374 [Clostridium butyricum]MBA8967315.1 hypothetical protein [Clostridium butyricum]MBA8971619.1 hypothetical protein [Clostridium butyricum]MBC2427300.1 hypothetical protein [Clostridium butyricum]MDU1071659.1 DrmE family protein [Clostridium sp.]
MYNDMILKSIEKLNIYYEGKEISLHDLEKRFIDTFLNEKENSNIYIIPKDSTYFIALFIIYSGLFQYLDNIYSDGNNLIDEIEPGDILEYSKARCEFIGSEDEKLKLKFSDLLYRLPIEQSYKISFYKGSATTLNKYPKDNNRGAKKTRNIISQILNIDNDVFSKVISKSTLIVAHKDSVFSIIEKLKIKFCGELLNIGEVFPIAYCLSEDNYYYFKGNSSKQEPIIKFTSKVYNAKDIIKKNKKINSVVILQDKINKDDLEDVIYISKKNNIDKIRLFFQPLQIEQYIGEERILENFKIVNINDKFFEDINVHDINMLNKKQYRLVKNYINVKEKYVTIKDSSQDRYRKNILRKCRNLINTFEDNNKIIKFIIDARTLAKRISSMIMPLPEYESFFENKNLKRYTIKSVLKELQSFSKSEFVDSLSNESKELISEIYNECLNLYYRELKINNKWTELETIIRLTKNERTGIIVENKYIRKAFRKYLKTRYSLKDNISVESMNTIKESVFEKVIYTSKLDNNYYWNYRALNSGNNIYILSKSEKNNIKYLKRKYLKFINQTDNLLTIDDEKIAVEELEVSQENNLNNELERFIATSYIPMHLNLGNNQTPTMCELVLTFQTGERAFITSQYEAYVLKEGREEIINKKAKNIEKGDVLLFVEEIEKDLIDQIMADLMNIEEIKAKYSEDYSLVKQWKLDLNRYMAMNNITYNELERKLKDKGVSRCGATIRSWLVNSVVGPQDQEVLKVLGEITSLEILSNKYTQCYEACSNIRKFQILIRKVIARHLLKSSINEEGNELDSLISNRIEEAVKYIKRVEVQNIYQVKKEIPMYLANKVIEEE